MEDGNQSASGTLLIREIRGSLARTLAFISINATDGLVPNGMTEIRVLVPHPEMVVSEIKLGRVGTHRVAHVEK